MIRFIDYMYKVEQDSNDGIYDSYYIIKKAHTPIVITGGGE